MISLEFCYIFIDREITEHTMVSVYESGVS